MKGMLLPVALAVFAASAPPAFAHHPPAAAKARGVEVADARVEQVFKAEDDGYQCISYQVTYHGKRVIVEDPLSSTDYAVGDKIYFLVMRHDMSKDHSDGKKLLSFMIR